MKSKATVLHPKWDKKGMTIIELVIAVSIVGIASVIALQFLKDQQRQSKKVEEAIEAKVDALLADKVMLKDFSRALPSINHLSIKDMHNKNFYDYDPDLNGTLYNASEYKFRSLILSYESTVKTNYVLVSDGVRGDPIFTEPIVAYSVGTPSDPNSPAPLNFVGLRDFLTVKPNGAALLDSNKLLFVDSFAFMPLKYGNPVLRSAAYLGVPDAGGNIVPGSGIPENVFDFSVYTENGKIIPANFDQFLRNLPAIGAGGSSIRIMPVKLLKYELVCPDAAEPKKCNLKRSEWSGGSFTGERTIMPNISEVNFFRESINHTVFSVTYKDYKKATAPLPQ